MDGKAPEIESKMNSVENVKEYLENEIGAEKLKKCYPILCDFGDDILFEDKIPQLEKKISHLLTS